MFLLNLLLLPLLSDGFSTSTIRPAVGTPSWTSRSVSFSRGSFVPAPATQTRPKQRALYPSQRSRVIIKAGWGPDPIWDTCTVLSSSPESKECVAITLEVTAKHGEEYTVPGQYCQVKVHGDDEAKPIFLAIASPPLAMPIDDDGEEKKDDSAAGGTCEFEFLVKRTDNNGWMVDAAVGAKVDVSQVLGGGFPMKEELDGFKYDFPTQNVLLFAAGSGIAPIRAAIESGQLNVAQPGEGGRTGRLYYGVRTPDDMPYYDKFAAWEAAGVEVVPVISQPEGTGWTGRTGYVQTALEEDGVAIPRNSGAVMCGMKGMAEAVKDLLTRSGVFEGRVLTNF